MTLKLPDPAPAWQRQLQTLIRERDAAIRAEQAPDAGVSATELARARDHIADCLDRIGQPVLSELSNRLSLHGAGWRVAGHVDHAAGALSVSITRAGVAMLDYALTIPPDAAGGASVIPRVSVRYAGGRPQGRAFLPRLEGATELDGITVNDVCADVTQALGEALSE